jgi:hypothetical protein
MRQYKQPASKLNQAGLFHHRMLLVMACIAVISVLITSVLSRNHADAAIPEIKSGISGYCLDVHNDSMSADAVVDSWACNDSPAQNWTVSSGTIRHGNDCLNVQSNGRTASDKIVTDRCSDAPGQVWLEDKGGFENPNSGLCLAIPAGQTNTQLVISSCNGLYGANESWTPTPSQDSTANNSCKSTVEGNQVACYAEKEWTAWQDGATSHETLLNTYTDGAPYEEWCADFVSYVYKEAGYSFTQGEANGWDESNANNIQNMGFTMHPATGYIPKPGDVAYFDYNGGHVEIVVSGGKTSTFVYGNSATIDPNTSNGQMMANTTANNGPEGQVIYYLSPN